jgi:hypothetical protein
MTWLDAPTQQPKCLHLALLGAVLSIGLHSVGHRFRCTCGHVFVVARDDEGRKVFR